MRHRDVLGRDLRVGQTVNCPDGSVAHVYALGRSQLRESVVLVTAGNDPELARHLSADVVALRTVPR